MEITEFFSDGDYMLSKSHMYKAANCNHSFVNIQLGL